MATFAVTDLTELLRSAGGVADGVDLDGEILDQTFDGLGYDSLAILEVSARIQQQYGLALPEEDVAQLGTPRELIDYLNRRLDGEQPEGERHG